MPYGRNATDGAGYRTWILLDRIAKDVNVNILSLYEDMYKREVGQQAEENGLRVIPTRCNRRAISSRINDFQPDVIYVASWPLSIFLPRTHAISLVDFIGSSLLENAYLGRYPASVAPRLKAEVFSKADLVICANERLRYYLTGFLLSRGIDKPLDSVRVIPLGPPAEPPNKSADFRTMKSKGQFIILVAGSLNPWYDYETLFKAVNEIPNTNLQIVFMGDNPTTVSVDVKRKLIDLAGKHGLGEKITITGPVAFKERCNYYLQADVGLNPAGDSWEDELSSRARLVDYLWAGLPVITSGRDYISKLAIESGEASYFAPHDYARLSQLIRRVISDKPSAVSSGRGRSRALEILDLDRYVPQLIESLNQLTKVERRPSLLCDLSYYAFVLKHYRRPALASTAGGYGGSK
jgi:glycosyltransferase involved in cell wall biosynthesis